MRPTGPATAIPEDALRLWTKVTELAAELPESEESQALAVSSRMLQLDYGWRLGMDPELAAALLSEARRSPRGSTTCGPWPCSSC